MDPQNPFRTLAPSVESDVLNVLVGTHAPLTGARVADLCGRSGSQVRAVLRNLQRHGLVHSERHGQAYSYVLNRNHVLIDAVEAVFSSRRRFEQRVSDAVATWTVKPVTAALFGSFIRRDGDVESDVDVLLVRPRNVAVGDAAWREQRHQLSRVIEEWVGNPAQILELSEDELAEAVRRDEPLIPNLRREAVSVFGDLASALRAGDRVSS